MGFHQKRYLIPAPVVKHFITGIEKYGHYVGFCSLNLSYQPMGDANIRSHFEMESKMTGVLIYKINQHSDAINILKKNDIILAIDDVAIGNDGIGNTYYIFKIFPYYFSVCVGVITEIYICCSCFTKQRRINVG